MSEACSVTALCGTSYIPPESLSAVQQVYVLKGVCVVMPGLMHINLQPALLQHRLNSSSGAAVSPRINSVPPIKGRDRERRFESATDRQRQKERAFIGRPGAIGVTQTQQSFEGSHTHSHSCTSTQSLMHTAKSLVARADSERTSRSYSRETRSAQLKLKSFSNEMFRNTMQRKRIAI